MYESKLRGVASEYWVAYFLSARWDLEVLIADSKGFDLLVKDPKGRLPGKRLKAISVKSRVRHKPSNLDINVNYSSLCEETTKWNAEPYFAFLSFHRFEGEERIHFMLVRACRENQEFFSATTKSFRFRKAWKMKSTENFRYFLLTLER